MKTKRIRIVASALFALTIGVIYTGCKKQDKKPNSYTSASDNANADNAFAGVWKQVSNVSNDSTSLRSTTSGYPTVSISPWGSTWPKDLVIDFGPTNVLGSDLVNRRGKITAHFTGRYSDSATVITITLTNYYHNDYHIQGTQTITNKGHISSGHLVYGVVVAGATVTSPSGAITTWNTNQDREWNQGEATPLNIYDDVYLIRGTASGVDANGEAYTILVNTDLRVNIGCPWIVSGKFTLTLNDYPTYPIVFDYGTGGCDATATALFNGATYTITMN